MKHTFAVPSVLLALVAVACGSTTAGGGASAEVDCGGAKAVLTPSANTYDDSAPEKGSTSISIVMNVYRAADPTTAGTDAGADGAAAPVATNGGLYFPPDVSFSGCPNGGLLARTTQAVELEPGTYFVCNATGGCGCLKVRLTGGPARYIFEAGPGGGNRSLKGCAVREP